MTTSETVTGRVEARNSTGIRVHGQWATVSRFKPVELPEVGSTVRLGLDAKSFITTLEVLDEVQPQASERDGRERTTTRLAVLEAAATFAAGRSDIKSGDVLRIAQVWCEWVEGDREDRI